MRFDRTSTGQKGCVGSGGENYERKRLAHGVGTVRRLGLQQSSRSIAPLLTCCLYAEADVEAGSTLGCLPFDLILFGGVLLEPSPTDWP